MISVNDQRDTVCATRALQTQDRGSQSFSKAKEAQICVGELMLYNLNLLLVSHLLALRSGMNEREHGTPLEHDRALRRRRIHVRLGQRGIDGGVVGEGLREAERAGVRLGR